MKTKYFLYARKSTEDEERQVMSIEAQIVELEEYAKREKLEIVERFIESKSAKKPGREVFNEMMAKINESKEAVGLLAWHPDRLARNSVDGGQIIYLIDTGKLVSLRFPTFWFEPTPQGLFMLQVAFGQSKYYSDNLAENVKRGVRQKLRRGEWTGFAPIGYVNNAKTRNIEPDPTKARVIAKAFEEFSQGKHTLESLAERLKFLGVASKTGKGLCKAVVKHMLSNPIYTGLIVHNGETYEGKFSPIVSLTTFETVQRILKDRAKPRKSKKSHNFPFVGLLRCGECGAAITAQYAHGHGGTYRYYRCTKRLGPCSQRYLREDLMAHQLKEQLSKVALCQEWTEKMRAQVDVWGKEQTQVSKSFAQNLEVRIKETEEKLNKLVNAFLDGTIEKETYLIKKDELIKLKTELLERKRALDTKCQGWNELLREWLNLACHVEKLASSEDFYEIKSLVEKIGTNRRLLNRIVLLDFKKPFDLIPYYKRSYEKEIFVQERAKALSCSSGNLPSLIWSHLLNAVRTYFENEITKT
jgi:DNA invertase Pin-like site-specific DNA recombinase